MRMLKNGWAILAALLVGGFIAVPTPALAADLPGRMQVYDDAGLFSSDAKSQAEKKLSSAKFDRGLHFTVDTHKTMPADIKAKFDKSSDKSRVMRDWAKSLAKGDRAKGPFVLICMNPGRTVVEIDEESINRGFGKSDEEHLFSLFDNALKDSAKKKGDERSEIRDAALIGAAEYVANQMKGTKVVHTDGTPLKDGHHAATTTKNRSMGIGGWICLGLGVLLTIWLVVGLIRAFTGGGGYYGGGPGYGGGGFGGGFGTALMGGLFGAMAGMWLYDHMMGTHYYNDAYAGDAYSDSGDTGDTGAGDYDDGSSTEGGGDYGGGDDGGGDYGGGNDGGGDYGGGDYGGGDYGGGGGDFGGGDF